MTDSATLRKMCEESSWRFEQASLTVDGQVRPFREVYEEAMGLLSQNSLTTDRIAEKLFRVMLEDAPVFAEGEFQLARLQFRLGSHEEALQHAFRAAAMAPQSTNFRILLIAILTHVRNTDLAEAEFDALLRDHADSFPFTSALPAGPAIERVQFFLNQTLARVLPQYLIFDQQLAIKEDLVRRFLEDLLDADKSAKALESTQAFLENFPEFGELRFYLVKHLMERGDTQDALSIARAGVSAYPNDWPCNVLAGVLSARSGDIREAFDYFERAALTNGYLPLFPYDSLNSKGRKAIAEWFEALLSNLPGYVGGYHDGWVYPPAPNKDGQLEYVAKNGATLALAVADIRETLTHRRGWLSLARNDILSRYRRTVLGPWWIVLGTGLALVGMSVIWSTLFGMTMSEFFPYMSAGYITWMFISSIMLEGCHTFADGQAIAIMRSMPMAKSLHVARLVTRNFIVFVHTLAIFVGGALVYGVDINANTLLFIPGLLLMILAAPAVSLLFGIIGLRYRDFGPALGAVVTVLFLVTPVLWKMDQLGSRGHYAFFNPLTHFISIMREPLLGQAPHILSYVVVIGVNIVLWGLALFALAKARNKLVYWI